MGDYSGETGITKPELDLWLSGAAGPAQPDTNTASETEDIELPTLEIIGDNHAEIEVDSTYSDNGVIVTDNVDSNLGHKIFVDGVEVTQVQLDTASSTTYTILYQATDQAGNVGEATRIVEVVGPEEELVVEEFIPTESSETEEVPIVSEEVVDIATTTSAE